MDSFSLVKLTLTPVLDLNLFSMSLSSKFRQALKIVMGKAHFGSSCLCVYFLIQF